MEVTALIITLNTGEPPSISIWPTVADCEFGLATVLKQTHLTPGIRNAQCFEVQVPGGLRDDLIKAIREAPTE